MIHSLLAEQVGTLENAIEESINYLDIDYDVEKGLAREYTTKTRSVIVKNDYAILNAYRIWLQSRYYDYIRNPGFGGFFDYNLNDRFRFSPDSEEAIRSAFLTESSLKWPDVDVLDAQIKCNMPNRSWDVRVIARDKNSGLVLNLNETTPLQIYVEYEEVPSFIKSQS